jgi:hypothetical protein
VGLRFSCEPVHDVDQLNVRGAVRIAKFIDRVGVGQLTQLDKLKDPLPPV